MLPKLSASIQPNLPNRTAVGQVKPNLTEPDLKTVYDVSAAAIALVFFIWALAKAIVIYSTFGMLYTATMVGMHLPLCAFSAFFATSFIRNYSGMGLVAVIAAVLNSLAI